MAELPRCFAALSMTRTSRAFSLVEMMIAMIILGMGLVMLATMFPVAWDRTRQLTEFTTQSAMVDAADTTVRLLARVDGLSYNATTFAGDLFYVDNPDADMSPVRPPDPWMFDPTPNAVPPYDNPPGAIIVCNDTRVHALHMENLRVESPRDFEDEEPWMRELVDDRRDYISNLSDEFLEKTYFASRIRFEARVHPPMPVRANRNDPDFTTNPDPRWDDLLDSRRYAWAVLHRLRHPILDLNFCAMNSNESNKYLPDDEAEKVLANTREFDLYHIVLRRPQPAYRYAQQDPSFVPDWNRRDLPVEGIKALPSTEDVVLPVPWRVQIELPDSGILQLVAPGEEPTGIPTEVSVGDTGDEFATNALAARLFQVGSFFVDEINGRVYRVDRYRLADDGQSAEMTLDSQILQNDIYNDFNADDDLEPEERLRVVWVYPPPVQRVEGVPDEDPIFDGRQPVIDIEVRSLRLSPNR